MPRSFRRRTLGTIALAALLTGAASVPAAHAAPAIAPIGNPDLLRGFSATERAVLARNGFVVLSPSGTRAAQNQPDLLHQTWWQFGDVYDEGYRQGIPLFITTDAALHTFHVIYDQTLVALERTVFVGTLRQFTAGLMDVATFQYGAAKDAATREAARLNLGYMAVAARLLDPQAAVPATVAAPVQQELALIAAHRGFASSPLFGYPVDYSLFVPRGHYAGHESLRRYFLAMTWFGGLTFHLNGPDATLRTLQAILLVRGIQRVQDVGKRWAALFDPITTWVGPSDDLTVRDYEAIMGRVYPADAPVSALADRARLARFISLANGLPGPRINGELAFSSKQAGQQGKGMRLFGRRFVPDAAIMEALIYDKVGTPQKPRVWPMGLDVAAGLGSATATRVLMGPLHQDQYVHYTRQLAAVQRTYSSLPPSTWSQNLYWGWLNTLRAEWATPAPAAPAFMKTGAWADKALAAGLGSWAELRHDTILYVKQPEGLGAGGQPPPRPDPYVEPAPLVFARLLALTQQLKTTLAAAGHLDTLPTPVNPFDRYQTSLFSPSIPSGEKGYRAALDGFSSLLALLQRVAERELLGQPTAASDENALFYTGVELLILTNFFQDNAFGVYQTLFDKQVAAIADVFTDPGSGQVLEEGVGDVLPIYAVVTVNGHRWLARGGVFSYYEFHQPMSDRLTDDAWRHQTRHPDQPPWTAGYQLP